MRCRVLLVWSAGIGARSFSPTPGGIGVVEAAMIAALVVAGVRAPQAVAAVLIYRLVNAKSTVTAVLLVHRFIGRLRGRPRLPVLASGPVPDGPACGCPPPGRRLRLLPGIVVVAVPAVPPRPG